MHGFGLLFFLFEALEKQTAVHGQAGWRRNKKGSRVAAGCPTSKEVGFNEFAK